METVIAIDQGTSSTRVMAFNLQGQCVAKAQFEIQQYYPSEGLVEQDPDEILYKTMAALDEVKTQLEQQKVRAIAMGITNQRETTVVWNKKNGKCIHKAIVWQDRRTLKTCLSLQTHQPYIHERTGLVIDPYFSATKIQWILDNYSEARNLAAKGDLLFGTIDTYLTWHLTQGKSHFTDVTNASRTMLFDINLFDWDQNLLDLFNIPKQMMPEVLNSDGHFGLVSREFWDYEIPITGVVGDQQSALVGQQCFKSGDAKMTYGTGAFLMLNTGTQLEYTKHLLTTVAYKTNNQTAYALEGSIFNAGTIMRWFRDQLNLLDDVQQSEMLASSIEDNGGVYLVPAFTGLGAPYWKAEAKAILHGMKLDTSKAHIVRAGLESVAYQTKDLLETIHAEVITPINQLKVDGGMVINQWLMKYIADLSQKIIIKGKVVELTALGAAMMASIGHGIYKDLKDFKEWYQEDWQLQPGPSKREDYLKWLMAVEICQYAIKN